MCQQYFRLTLQLVQAHPERQRLQMGPGPQEARTNSRANSQITPEVRTRMDSLNSKCQTLGLSHSSYSDL